MSRKVLLVAGITAAAVALAIPPVAYSHRPITTNLVFKREIAQIFQRRCFQCHSENNLAMSLTTYTQARPWARAIREEVLERKMPPWGAVTGFGHFANDNSLTQREMDIILQWADGGAPSGVPKAEEDTPPVFVPPAVEWPHGEPDVTLATPAHAVEGGSGNAVQRFELPTGLKAPAAIRAVAFRPGDRRVVRYAAIYEGPTGRWLGTWTPWTSSLTLPSGAAFRLPARGKITVEVGYRSADESVTDKSEIGLYFERAPKAASASHLVIAGAPASVPAGASAERVRTESLLASNITAAALWPEPGPGATSLEVSAYKPDGSIQPLVWVKDYRADWPSPYVFKEPIALPKGTRVRVTTYYANDSDKARQAKPRVTLVRF